MAKQSRQAARRRGVPGRWIGKLAMGLAVAMLLGGAGGCYFRGKSSLAADSLSDRPGVLWPASPQHVHVGETVHFSLLVKPTIDNYAVFQFPDREVLAMADPSRAGYRVSYTFKEVTPPGGVTITAKPYRVRGRQDRMTVSGRIAEHQSPGDPPDDAMKPAGIQIIVYQPQVEFSGVAAGVQPDWSKSFVRIIADGGKRVSPDIAMATRAGESATGYRVVGPDGQGAYKVVYSPSAEQISRGGVTLAELHLTDTAGRTQVISKEFATP